jgi:hypothetical protein
MLREDWKRNLFFFYHPNLGVLIHVRMKYHALLLLKRRWENLVARI